jgi:hypothetical protein
MSSALSCVVLAALSTADIGVALTRRSGVSKPVAAARVGLVQSAIKLSGEVVDLTQCQGRLACLVKAARERKWTAMVTIETANVLSDAIVDVKLLQVEEDGRQVAAGNVQVVESALAAALDTRLDAVRRAVRALVEPTPVPLVTAPIEVRLPPPPPPPLERPTPPPPVVEVAAPEAPAGRPAARWVPLGVSLGVTVAGAVFMGLSAGAASRLKLDIFTTEAEINDVVASGRTYQTVGMVGLVAGGVLSVASLVLALAWPDAAVTPGAFWLQGGAGLAVAGSFP